MTFLISASSIIESSSADKLADHTFAARLLERRRPQQ
jgi:hypothetical protein